MALAKVLKVAAAAGVLSIAAFPVISIITKEKVRLEADVYPGEVFKPFSVDGDRLRSRIEGWGEATLSGTFKPIEVLGRAESLERVILSNLGTDPARDIRVRSAGLVFCGAVKEGGLVPLPIADGTCLAGEVAAQGEAALVLLKSERPWTGADPSSGNPANETGFAIFHADGQGRVSYYQVAGAVALWMERWLAWLIGGSAVLAFLVLTALASKKVAGGPDEE